MTLRRSATKDWRFQSTARLADRAKDPARLLAAQNEQLPCSGYFSSSRLKSSQVVVTLCSGAAATADKLDGGAPATEVANAELKWRSWTDSEPSVREKLVEEQLKFYHKEYCRLFQTHGEKRTAKGGGKDKSQPCRSCADPTPEYLQTVVIHMRRLTTERVVFHYIYHRAPSANMGKIEDKLLLYGQDANELRTLPLKAVHQEVGSPATYIFDCPHAGRLVNALNDLLSADDDVVALGACSEFESLPFDRFGLPLDLFTACLMSPVRAALNFYRTRGATILSENLLDCLQSVCGKAQDRSTPLGELTSIYTAITDAIAWSSFEPHIFKRLFREDGTLAELFRNFLLAQRMLVAFNLHATSRPSLPPTHCHHLWDVWDSVLELFLVRLSQVPSPAPSDFPAVKTPSFFEEQMGAFWVWLRFHPELSGNRHTVMHGMGAPCVCSEAPVELPIVLHGLLHPSSRLEALRLLASFVDLGVGAVHFTLLVGARPYLTKLLSHDDKEATPEVSPLALLAWTKMLSFDADGKEGVLNKDSYRAFFNLAKADSLANHERAFANVCLAVACHNRMPVKVAVHGLGVLDLVVNILRTSSSQLLLWMTTLLCAEVCRACLEAAKDALNGPVAQVLLNTLRHPAQAVRASAVYAIGSILKALDATAVTSWDTAVPLFRRFLGLGTTGPGSVTPDPPFLGGSESAAAQADKLLWLASSMIWHFCSASHSVSPSLSSPCFNHSQALPGGIPPDCGILNETSMLVRHELFCALAPWVDDLSASHAECFAYFESLPLAPWDAQSLATPEVSQSSQPSLKKSAGMFRSMPSCPALAKIVDVCDDDSISNPFTSVSIVYDWTVNCLQQPNALSHAVNHDMLPDTGNTLEDQESARSTACSTLEASNGPHWDPEGIFLPSTPHDNFQWPTTPLSADRLGTGAPMLSTKVGRPSGISTFGIR